MSKLKAWHILVPTVVLMLAGPVTVWFTSVSKQKAEVAATDEKITAARETAAERDKAEAELQQAQLETAVVAKELGTIKNAKLPIWSGNPWWRSLRQGMAFMPGAASIRVGESGTLVNLPDGMPAMFDMWFLLREDLGVQLRDYFDAAGCQVTYDLNLPTPQVSPYSTPSSLVLQVPLTGVRVQGKYDEVLRFFRRLGYAPLLIQVLGDVTFAPVAGSEGDEIVATANLVVWIFPNLPPDKMSDLLPIVASALSGGGAAAAGAGAMGPMGGMGGGSAAGPMAMGPPGGGAGPPAMPAGTAGASGGGGSPPPSS